MKKLTILMMAYLVVLTGCEIPFFGGQKNPCEIELSATRNTSTQCQTLLGSCTSNLQNLTNQNQNYANQLKGCNAQLETAQNTLYNRTEELHGVQKENIKLRDRISFLEANAGLLTAGAIIIYLISGFSWIFLSKGIENSIEKKKLTNWLIYTIGAMGILFIIFLALTFGRQYLP
ncbi:MAG: hypothetical protein AABX51_07315 [Nanoarchaeota archaeon]